ncbi:MULTISPECIES: OPT family oligopeptide transporter [Brevundimonas]|jgi:putative OPT family oligopeptide transporter|uniref:OPT family oligopeptide transporter n=1 Tax=Brevundimonas TaxID=41275 RepID=UPI001905F075|nr:MULTISPECIES: oligopeptide transporter, OPT family [Brevundimonas]MDA0744376.1 oligopeptide transporter, OPT family [Pseudomonadota bacterium]MBK1970685.1 oligopeptide transporter, OPT family [Brevundimonas diminuta]MBK1975951.1 oligopeptide transporter, OPT family [Brevundimonas diminuta]MDA1322510.1 oligopeptide transporter, OPT family [Pseudomonadota bacterium]MDM8352323.1 oligopeptide transporter, OPT family [Brevundimonas diminuta]
MTDKPAGTGKRIELTIRALILGCLLAAVFTAANTYLGLKVGLTFASAIPAAVISMALLRAFRGSTIWENMTVQTVASVGGAMSSIIFVLPGLVMIGWWMNFPFWESVMICILGGVLGVTFSIPLRRTLVVQGGLPYPEGVAAAEVLKVGSPGAEQTEEAVRENKSGLFVVVGGAIASAVFSFLASARVFAHETTAFLRLPAAMGGGATGVGFSMQFALLGAGHLIGLAVGLTQLFGLVLAWLIFVPILTSPEFVAWAAANGVPSIAATVPAGAGAEGLAMSVWSQEVRFIGAGVIGVAALWTLAKLAKPLVAGLASAVSAQSRRAHGEILDRTEQDIPIKIVGLLSVAALVGIAVLLAVIAQGTSLAASAPLLVIGGLVYVVVIGFAVAAICGYMAGLIGSSNSPVSGVGILAIIIASLLMLGVLAVAGVPADPSVIAFALIVTAIVFAVAVISNDNLQDLKTGQLVEATPWRQQTALLVGVVAGALVIPFVLDMMNQAFGFEGGPPAIVQGSKTLAAPQATLISALAKGVISGDLRWDLIGIGAVVGVLVIILDIVLRRTTNNKIKLPPLAAGIGVYLPAAVTTMLVIGAVCGWLYDRAVKSTRYADVARRMGVLLASGLIVGESLFGVFTAAVIVSTRNEAPFALLPEKSAWPAMIAGVVAFVVLTYALYAWVRRRSAQV